MTLTLQTCPIGTLNHFHPMHQRQLRVSQNSQGTGTRQMPPEVHLTNMVTLHILAMARHMVAKLALGLE